MGLFSNNKKLCPICGNPTPRLLATKVENMPICKACDKKVDLPVGTVDKMTLEEFQQYMAYYDENEPLRRQFQRTYLYAFGLFSGDLVVDDTHRLLRLKQNDDALVLKGSDIRSFRICEDGFVLYESGWARCCATTARCRTPPEAKRRRSPASIRRSRSASGCSTWPSCTKRSIRITTMTRIVTRSGGFRRSPLLKRRLP